MLKEEAGRQFSMFMSENICSIVGHFDKAVTEGRVITVETRSEGEEETEDRQKHI